MAEKTLTLIEHLEELRIHILRFCVVFLICTAVTYAYRKELLDFIRKPVEKPLQKYTQQHASLEANQQHKGTKLLNGKYTYTCNCNAPQKESLPVKKPIADSSAKTKKQNWFMSSVSTIKSTFNDFYTFFQNKTPKRVRQEAIAKQNQEQQDLNRLNCVRLLRQVKNFLAV